MKWRAMLWWPQARLIAVALAMVGAGLALLGVVAAGHVRNTAGVFLGRDLEAVGQYARYGAQDLHYQVLLDEGELLRSLELGSLDALVESLARIESDSPGVTCFVLMDDGSLRHPRWDPSMEWPAPQPGEAADEQGPRLGGESVRTRALTAVMGSVEVLLRRLGTGSVARASLAAANGPLTVSLFRLRAEAFGGAVGVCWSEWFVGKWCERAAQTALPPGYALAVDGPGARLLYGSRKTPPEGERAGSGGLLVSAPLPADGFPWVVRVGREDVSQIEEVVRRQVLYYGGVLAVMLLLIVLGVWMLVATSLKQMELGRMKADFAANVSHELRTPLALIRGAADTLCGGRELGAADRARYLGIIGRESERLTELIDTVMKYTALERGPAATALMPADVCALVREFTAEQRRRLEEEGFVVRTAIPDAPLEARLDAEAMRLVLVNLFSNAVKFAGARKEITVTVTDRDAGLAIRVSDRGIGIAEGDKRRIFDVFYRAEGELVKKTRGTGIGLALARQIVHAHKGRISVESTLGEGATFTVWLPRVPPAQRPGPQAQDVPADGLGAR